MLKSGAAAEQPPTAHHKESSNINSAEVEIPDYMKPSLHILVSGAGLSDLAGGGNRISNHLL